MEALDGWMCGWMDVWVDGWMNGCIDEWMYDKMDGWVNVTVLNSILLEIPTDQVMWGIWFCQSLLYLIGQFATSQMCRKIKCSYELQAN